MTLTPQWADRLNVEIVEVGPAERPKWGMRQAEEEKRPIVAYMFEARIRLPEQVPDPKSIEKKADVWTDEYSGEPVRLLGQEVPVDPRLKGKK